MATRTSYRWKSLPGNFDPHNIDVKIFPSLNKYGIPQMAPTDFVPEFLVQYGNKSEEEEAGMKGGGATMFFLEDYRFYRVWNNPQVAMERIKLVGAALSPDFSLYRDWPLALQQYSIYQNRWCGCYWQSYGIPVIPTIEWASEKSYEFCFLGAPRNSVVAISPVGLNKDKWGQQLFIQGLDKMCEVLEPKLILCYGKLEKLGIDMKNYPPIKMYSSRWELRHRKGL